MMRKEVDMTYEGALKAINANLEKFRVEGDDRAVKATLVMKEAILKEMGAEVAKDYIKIYGDA
jgi:hypothetical protein|tara:strand:- start:9 stop:197 length:189 start_codon:yes stop_codon:yes gene_type:complete